MIQWLSNISFRLGYHAGATRMRKTCEDIARSIDSKRGNELHIARAIRALSVALSKRDSDVVCRLRKENDTLRGLLANSEIDCVYCGLPATMQNRCAHGFPGCPRADDQLLNDLVSVPIDIFDSVDFLNDYMKTKCREVLIEHVSQEL